MERTRMSFSIAAAFGALVFVCFNQEMIAQVLIPVTTMPIVLEKQPIVIKPVPPGLNPVQVGNPSVEEFKKAVADLFPGVQVFGKDRSVKNSGEMSVADLIKIDNSYVAVTDFEVIYNKLISSQAASRDTLRTAITATGDFKGVLGSNSTGTVSTGSLGVRFEKRDFALSGQVSVASANDTLARDFGHSLLIPKSGQASGLIDFIVKFCQDEHTSFFIHTYGFLNTTTWSVPDTLDKKSESLAGGIAGMGLLFGWTMEKIPSSGDVRDAAGLSLEGGYSLRGLSGDLSQQSEVRSEAMNTDERSFGMFELGFQAFYKNITAGITYYKYTGGADVPGFSRGQLVGGVSIRIDFASF